MKDSRVITERQLILGVAKRWREAYCYKGSWQYGDGKGETYKKILKMDLSLASAEDVAGVLGNGSWTRLECDECRMPQKIVRECGQPSDYESATAHLCESCLRGALAEIEDEVLKK